MVDDDSPSIDHQVWSAVDPTGENRVLIDAAIHEREDVPLWLRRVGKDLGEALDRLAHVGEEYRTSILGIAGAIVVLVPRGWAPLSMHAETVFQAVQLADDGRGEEADQLLAAQGEGDDAWRLTRVCKRVGVMGANDPELSRLFRERARLLGLAMEHHLAGRYDASIPLLQAQLEGITMDVTGGKKFFTKGTAKADLVDPKHLAGIAAGLAALQATYGQDVRETQTRGSLSRHGIAHGRELAYDTRINSAKTWSVVDAFVDWAMPKARDLVEARMAERQAATAGSEETDERGRRVDDREIAQTRDALRLLQTSAMGWHTRRGGFRADLIGSVYGEEDFMRRGLPANHGIEQRVSADKQEVAYWRRTVSGWVLGLGIVAQRGGAFGEYLYAGQDAPAGLPSEDEGGWFAHGETPPDWSQ
ncbi:hypothetical protein GA707_03490 [Nostocoides sp. F2B08]|uniref:hypothetical protein n=1 Tax=Nostocoides sp. F2B08 TaxID=2653936 RepID=UPI001262FA9A|nr:hypothetical protein [Tetrasphaera sp. F2B08]KAB7746559.1 hypothetical protein GA707_03490 [Tetrasphaera sp. F2B08]